MPQGRFDQRIRSRLAVLFLQIFFQRAGVDANADRDIHIPRFVHHRANALFPSDVAGIDAQTIHTQVRHPQGNAVIKVDIRHQGNIHLFADGSEGFGGLHARDRDAHDIRSGKLQALNLIDGRGHIGGFGVGHALHGDRRSAPNGHIANHNLAGLTAYNGRLTVHDAIL